MEQKKKITQEDLARICRIDQGSISRILNKDTRDSFADETVEKVFRAARESGYLHPALVTSNRRESLRKKAGFQAEVAIIIGTTTVYDTGQVEVDEVSMSGMLLRNFRTKKQSFPMDRFKFDVEITSGRLKGFKCRCKLIRFSDNENEFALGVRFDQMDDSSREKIKNFVK